MPRDSSGNYTLPSSYNPVLTGTTITTAWANTTMNDIAAALTDSLSRSGRGGLTAPFLLTDGTAGAPSLAFIGELSTGLYRNGASTPTFVVNGQPIWSSNSTKQFIVSASGGTILSAPTSGYALTVNGPQGITIPGAAATQLTGLNIAQSGQQAWSIYQPASNDDLRISGSVNGDIIRFAKTGITILSPPSPGGNSLVVNGYAGVTTVVIQSVTTAGQSQGLVVNAGTNTSDYCVSFANASGSGLSYLQGDGQNFIITPPAFTDRSGSTLYQIGYMDAPVHQISASATLGVTDRGKTIELTGGSGQTLTLPSGMPGGAMILVVNVSGNSWTIAATALNWLPSGSTAQPRILANFGIMTCWSSGGSTWYIWGAGIS